MTTWARIRPVLLSIRTKLTLPYVLLAIFVAVGGGLVVSQVALNSLEERFTNQLIETRKLASDSMVKEESDLLETLRLISHTQGIAEAVRSRDKHTIAQLIYPVTFNAGQDAVILLDSRGLAVLALIKSPGTGGYDTQAVDDSLARLPFVSKVLDQQVDAAGDKYAGISHAAWGDYFFVSGPVKDADGKLVGVALVGESLPDLVRQVREQTLSQATFYDLQMHPIASSFADVPPSPQAAPVALLATDDEHGLVRDLDVRQIAYTELLSPWKVRGTELVAVLGTALPKAFLVRTSGITRFNITAITILAILLALLLGISLSASITRPILKLKHAASEVSSGNLSTRVDARGDDEVAVLSREFNAMVASLKRSEDGLVSAYDDTLEGWSRVLEMRDADTSGHTRRVVETTLALARAMDVDERSLVHVRRGAFLHDLGKMGIPDSILLKPGALSPDEWRAMQKHPLLTRQMLQHIDFLKPAMAIPLYHHERWDGSGYPYGLSGEQIPLVARIFSVIDVWDALSSDRPYRAAWSEQKAIQYIRENSGTQFDPKVVDIFLRIIDVLRSIRQHA